VPEDKGALLLGTAEGDVAAVPVPMVAVQSGDAGTGWNESVAAALGLTLFVMLSLVSVVRVA
jgi:ABC-type phosphate transport system permease subunit